MHFVHNCPLCGRSEFRIFDKRKFLGHDITNLICLHCGLVFMSPRMDDEELERFYTKEYRKVYQSEEGPTENDLLIQRERAKHIAEILISQIPAFTNHLDIGCSSGALMEELVFLLNCKSIGVEPSEAYRTFCLGRDLIVFRSLDDLPASFGKSFNLVTLSHVLEHMSDPVDYLSKLRTNFLREDGFLLIEVPNLFAHNCFEIAHNFSFSPFTLYQTLKKAGFNMIYLKKHGFPRTESKSLYLTALAQSQSPPILYGNIRRVSVRLVYYRREAGLLGISVPRLVLKKVKKKINRLFDAKNSFF